MKRAPSLSQLGTSSCSVSSSIIVLLSSGKALPFSSDQSFGRERELYFWIHKCLAVFYCGNDYMVMVAVCDIKELHGVNMESKT